MSEFSVPDIPVSKELIERVQFSVASRNAEAKVSTCLVHVFGSRYADDPRSIEWQYVSSGVSCLLRNRELGKGGKKHVWSMNMCLYNAVYGVLVWKGKLAPSCGYTAVADNFHVFHLTEVDALVGILFAVRDQATELLKTYCEWHEERMRDEKGKGASPAHQGPKFRKEMISKPCNFQHIQGTQALDECIEIEKIKTDIQAAFFGLGPRGRQDSASRRSGSISARRKKEVFKTRSLDFDKVDIPHTAGPKSADIVSQPDDDGPAHLGPRPLSMENGYPYQNENGYQPPPEVVADGGDPQPYSPDEYHHHDDPQQPYLPEINVDAEVAQYTGGGASEGNGGFTPPDRLSPFDLEKEFTQSELFTSTALSTHTN